jgi:hypothetical protein
MPRWTSEAKEEANESGDEMECTAACKAQTADQSTATCTRQKPPSLPLENMDRNTHHCCRAGLNFWVQAGRHKRGPGIPRLLCLRGKDCTSPLVSHTKSMPTDRWQNCPCLRMSHGDMLTDRKSIIRNCARAPTPARSHNAHPRLREHARAHVSSIQKCQRTSRWLCQWSVAHSPTLLNPLAHTVPSP